MSFSQRLKELRAENGLTQRELAAKLNQSPNSICEWEKERCEPSIESLKKLSALFSCSIDYLTGNSDDFGTVNIPVKEKSADVLSTDERKLIETYRKLNAKNQMHVGVYATLRLEEQEENKKTV